MTEDSQHQKHMLSIGQLAKRAGVRTSALRYYEEQGLLRPAARQANGYRLYDANAEDTLRFIQRAQRLGFALADIRALLQDTADQALTEIDIVQTTEARYLAIAEDMTRHLVLQHEMSLFLQDLHARLAQQQAISAGTLFEQLRTHVCTNPHTQTPTFMLDWLLQQTGCQLTSTAGTRLLDQLRGQHVHIWQEEEGYFILVVSTDPAVGAALTALADLEAQCQMHIHEREAPELMHNDEGYLLVCRGRNAFIFARLFLTLSGHPALPLP